MGDISGGGRIFFLPTSTKNWVEWWDCFCIVSCHIPILGGTVIPKPKHQKPGMLKPWDTFTIDTEPLLNSCLYKEIAL